MPNRPIYVFDAYGTLFDVHSAVGRFRDQVGPKADIMSSIWRAKQLEYTWIHACIEEPASFAELTEQSLDFAIAAVGADVSLALRAQLLSAYRSLKPYPEVPGVLAELRKSGARLAILSNGDPDMLDQMVDEAGFGDTFEAVLSVAQSGGIFKPARQVYELVTGFFAVAPMMVSFQSSNRWDIAGAAAFGFKTVWINRSRAPDEYPALAPNRVIRDLSALAAANQA